VKFCAASDQAMLVYLGDEIGLRANERVLRLLRVLQKQPPKWLRNLQPAYASLMVTFDPTSVDYSKVEAVLRAYEQRAQHLHPARARVIEIAVCYGGEFGPDLEDVAKLHGLKPAQVIEAHTARTYHAYFLGFAPGFAYLGDLPNEIATPRLPAPRKQVPAGSVAIAGKQTAVYPLAVPGGWRLIGRTPTAVFDKDRKPMARIAIGDQVKFRPISREEFVRTAST
jgi:inhibitor of KinA